MHALALSPSSPSASAVVAELPVADDLRCLAHDLKNKLQVVSGYCELLMAPTGALVHDEKGRAHVARIRAAAEQSCQIAERMILPRLPAVTVAAVDLNALLIDEVGPICQELLRERINIIVEQGTRVPPVRVDPLGLARTVINLAQNARDAIRSCPRLQGGRITFSTSLPAIATGVPYAILAVSDTGPGMDAATLARIWEPGWSTKDRGSGLRGYGLASVHAFVTNAGGAADVHSEPGKGTTFSLCLPAARPEG